ncbi:doublecortin domain-containing protein 2-like isoform X1 [Syngnathus acus]|uniref:doublecortin domain-containing protein 2-like isoform X1 n=1 Tax=Syngnathus acus TaxID=161584 RepID=UPI001885B44A|nr:doublecortin domain-containing protein 2-like isoform X1 [Syngnathus acus]
MGSEKPNFLSQPVVKNIFMFRNGDPYYEARRVVINQRRICNFETFLREVTSGIQAPFGAVRNIYTPRRGHKVESLDNLQSGEQYVAAGRERFKKLDYLQIGFRKRRMLQSLPLQAKPLPPNRICVSARFLKPIKEPCPIFVVANGDTMNPAIRLLIHQRMLRQFDKILEMITEKMGLRVLGGVRSLYTHEGQQVTDGTKLESGQLYVAVGRERFKRLSYADLLFSNPRGARQVNGMKMGILPPIYRFPKQHGNRKSVVRSTDSGEGESKASPLHVNGGSRDQLSSFVREISQARLLSLRFKKSGQSITTGDNDDLDSKADYGNAEVKSLDQSTEEDLASDVTKSSEESGEKAEEKQEASAENTFEKETSVIQVEGAVKETTSPTKGGGEEENEAAKNENEGEVTALSKEQAEEVKEVKDTVVNECKRVPDERRATPDETREASGHSKKNIAEESREKSADVSEATANVSKDASDENQNEISVEHKEKEEMADESKDEVANDCRNESRNEVKDEVVDKRKNENTNESKDGAVDHLANESKDEVVKSRDEFTDETADKRNNENTNESQDIAVDHLANESKDEVSESREDLADKAPNESKDETPNESNAAAVDENKGELAFESKDETPNESNAAAVDENKDETPNESNAAAVDENKDETPNESNAVDGNKGELAIESKDETPDENKSVTSSGDQMTVHLNNINGDTKEGQNEG